MNHDDQIQFKRLLIAVMTVKLFEIGSQCDLHQYFKYQSHWFYCQFLELWLYIAKLIVLQTPATHAKEIEHS